MSTRPMVANSASEKEVRKGRQRASLARRRELDQWRELLELPAFRRRAWRLLERCGVYTQVDVESTNRVLVNEGKRSVGLWLIAEIEAASPGALELLRAQVHADLQQESV